jgi:hypothetical protein
LGRRLPKWAAQAVAVALGEPVAEQRQVVQLGQPAPEEPESVALARLAKLVPHNPAWVASGRAKRELDNPAWVDKPASVVLVRDKQGSDSPGWEA